MTTSPKPWSTHPDGRGCIIKDCAGNLVAKFEDWRDADELMVPTHLHDQIRAEQNRVDELEDALSLAHDKNRAYETEVALLNTRVEGAVKATQANVV